MSTIYSNDDYAHQRLRNCVVMRNGKPFYIEGVYGKGIVRGTPLEGKELEECEMETVPFSFDEGFTLQTVPMGYMNTRGSTVYLSRIPQRRWRQGLVADAVAGGRLSSRNFFSKNFCNMVNGTYPSFDECLRKVVRGGTEGQAFSRKFAIMRNREGSDCARLFYKRAVVGRVFKDGSYELDSKYMYLEKRLRKAMKC